jgi:uncharacterized protein YqeY
MTLLTDIKDAQLVARKAHDAVATGVLTTLYSEAAMVGKNANPPRESTDAEVAATIRKFLKTTREFIMMAGDRRDADTVNRLSAEEEILEGFLPQQMTVDEITAVVRSFVEQNGLTNSKSMGLVMTMLKEQYGGMYDGKVASQIIKDVLGN